LVAKSERLLLRPRSHMELPQVGLYQPGQLYAPHFDAVEPSAPSGRLFLANGGQRIATLLCYLNTPSSGGRTSFPTARKLRSDPLEMLKLQRTDSAQHSAEAGTGAAIFSRLLSIRQA
jgi:hypothetical protein